MAAVLLCTSIKFLKNWQPISNQFYNTWTQLKQQRAPFTPNFPVSYQNSTILRTSLKPQQTQIHSLLFTSQFPPHILEPRMLVLFLTSIIPLTLEPDYLFLKPLLKNVTFLHPWFQKVLIPTRLVGIDRCHFFMYVSFLKADKHCSLCKSEHWRSVTKTSPLHTRLHDSLLCKLADTHVSAEIFSHAQYLLWENKCRLNFSITILILIF